MGLLKADVVVIGGGAVGSMCVLTAAQRGLHVVLLEPNKMLGKKLRITGKGRCNVTNHCDVKTILANIPGDGRFLYSALNRLGPQDTMALFESLGVLFKTERGNGPAFFVTMIIAELVLGILASIIVMWFSRRREFRADQGGASLAGRRNMIAALERLNAQHPQPLPEKMAAFGIAGGVGSGLKRLFMTHPPLEERIAALKAAEQ